MFFLIYFILNIFLILHFSMIYDIRKKMSLLTKMYLFLQHIYEYYLYFDPPNAWSIIIILEI